MRGAVTLVTLLFSKHDVKKFKENRMRVLSLSVLTLALVSIPVFSIAAEAANTRVTYPSVVSLEVLGRTTLYTVGFDQVVNENIAVGAGFGSVSAHFAGTDIDANKTISMVPVYLNYYLLKEQGTPFVTAGATLITNHSSVKGLESTTGNMKVPSSNVMPTVGVGYENRGDNGFLFRVTAYGIMAKKFTPWMGFSFGYGF